ncbi:MAG TPA: TIGR04282 family arsenosugar biosynthesis glycosyltransferase [Candidatus Eisenbacteria bacterium]
MRRIALFARWPRAGEVKTRLSPALPAALACDLHRAMLEDALALAGRATSGERLLYWADAPAARDGFAPPPGFGVRDQRGVDLGERLERAFGDLLKESGDRAVILGGDCPALEAPALDQAFDALERHDLVLGPAGDGGYYLVGLARKAPELFRGIEWSTPRVLDQTLARAGRAGLTVHRLGALDDLDTPADLVRWIALRAAGGGPGAPLELDRVLQAMGLLPPGVMRRGASA